MPHLCHIRIARSGEEVLCWFWLDHENKVVIPSALLYQADWIYDLDDKKILKNKTGRNRLISLGVDEVDRSWLRERGFVRTR